MLQVLIQFSLPLLHVEILKCQISPSISPGILSFVPLVIGYVIAALYRVRIVTVDVSILQRRFQNNCIEELETTDGK